MKKTALLCLSLLVSMGAHAQTIHRFSASSAAYEANAYLVEGKTGWVLVDALMLKDDLAPALALIKQSGKPLEGVLLTHPHVDHFAGVSWLQGYFPKLPVYMTKESEAAMQQVHKNALTTGWIKIYGDQYPTTLEPNVVTVTDGQNLSIAGLDFKVHHLGEGEAADHIAYEMPNTQKLFSGDALLSSYVVYVGEGHSKSLLALYDHLQQSLDNKTTVYPGHGGVASLAQVVNDNRHQVTRMREIATLALADTQQKSDSKGITPELARKVGKLISAEFGAYSGYGMDNEVLITNYNVRGLLTELINEQTSAAELKH